MTYDIDELDSATFGRKPSPFSGSRPSAGPLSPFEERAKSKFDFDALEQEAGLGRATGLATLASTFGERDRDIKVDSLRADLRRYFGGDAPVVNRFTLDDAQRRLNQAQMDHALRDAPRTTKLFEQSVATGGSTYWAKDLADIERAWATNSKKAAEAGIWRDAPYRGLADILKRIDAIPSPLGFAAEMSSVGKIWDIYREGGMPALGRVAEGAPRNIASGVYDLVGGTLQVGGALWDIIGKTLEPIFGDLGPSELTRLSGAIRKFADSVAYRPPEGIGPVEQGGHSGMRSLGSMLLPTAAGAAQALTAPKMAAGVASAWMAGSVGGTTYGENLEKTGDVYRAALHGIADAGWEYIFERVGGNSALFDKATWAKGFFGGVAKFVAREVPSEMATTFAQKVDEWVYKTPERTVSEFIDELPDDMIETAVATLVGGGGQIALAKGVEAVARIGNVQSRAEDEAALLAQLFPLAAKSDAFRADPQTFQQFFQEATDGATVLVDRARLEEAMLTGSIDPGVLPSLQAQQNIPGEIEIPVAELVTAFAGTPAEAAIIQHVRPDPEAPTLAEAREEGNKAMEVLREVGAAAMERHAQNKAFSDQMAAIKEEIVADLNNRAAFGAHASTQYAELVGHFYATLADKLGVTPIQVRDGWYDGQGRERRGYRLRISADQTREKIAATPEDFAPGRVANILNRGGWAIVTAENPGGKTATPEENAAQQALLKAELDKAGYTYEQIEGKYAPDGEEQTAPLEHPFLVYGVDTARALELGRLFGQESVLTREGLVYHDGTVEPTKRVIEHKTEPANYWSRVPSTGAMFTADIDSGNRVPLGEFAQSPAGPRARANAFSVLRGVNTIASAEQLALSREWGRGRDFKLALDARVREVLKGKGIDPGKWTPDSEEYLTHMLVSEASAALDKDTRAVGWYNDRVTRAMSILSLIHPELATDENAKFAFIWALAVTSNGLRVDQNFQLAEQAYSAYKSSAGNEAGRVMPTDIGVGTTAGKIDEGLQAFNDTVAALGYDGAREFMLREMTVRDLLSETGKKVSGEGVDTVVLGASILGPKIGNGFFANLYGNFDQLTMDRWFVRTWGRWTGGLVRPKSKEYLAERAAELRGLIGMLTPAEKKELQSKWGVKLRVTDLLGLAQELSRATVNRDTREQVTQVAPRDPAAFLDLLGKPKAGTTRFSVGDEIRKLANKIARGVDGQVESPGNSTNRNFMRAVYTRGLSILQEEYPGLTMSDLQAVMWYPEKLLYDTAGLSTDALKEYEDEEVPDYANAAANLAKERGVAIPPELETDQRPAVVRGGKSSAGAFQQGAGPEQKGYPPGLTLQAVHFSTAERKTLDPAFYGRGISGAERTRVAAAKDSRIKRRTHFYANTGQGVFPEQGVGAHAHVVTLHNLYDADVDPLGLFKGQSDAAMNAAESGVLDAGYDGYVTRTFGRQAAVVYFKPSRPDRAEFRSIPSVPPVQAPAYSSTQETRRTIVNSKSLPMGQLPADKWRRYIAAAHPELMATLNRDGVFERAEALGRLLYRDEIARLLSPPPGEFYQNLEGLPSKIDVDGKTVEFGEFPAAKAAAEAYMARAGLPYNPPRVYVPVDVERAKRIAQAFEEMKHDPNDPDVAAAYAALAREVTEQYRAVMAAGLKVEFIPSGQPDPYGNPRNAILDIVNNNHMWVYSTRDGFGQGEVEDSPMLAETEFQISGQTALVNDLFRVVHDYFGHAMNGVGFRAAGEENAWREHWSMLSPLARKALTTETRGQNSWLNYGPHGEKNRTAKTEDTVFAPQKVGLLPDWVVNDGATDASTGFAQTSWYSPLARALEQAKQDAMPAAQWKAWLASNAGNLGVKADEIQWSGIYEYLDLRGKDKVTKAEITDYLSGNGVRVEDVVKSEPTEEEVRAYLRDNNLDSAYAHASFHRIMAHIDLNEVRAAIPTSTKFPHHWESSYKGGIPGTYREILVTLPEKVDALPPGWKVLDRGEAAGVTRYAALNPDGVKTAYASTEAEAVNRANRFGKAYDGRAATSFRSTHWDEPNVLVHVRLDEVTGADGKRYVRVGEIQSDWGQEGKKKGFASAKIGSFKIDRSDPDVVRIVDEQGNQVGGYSVNASYGLSDEQLLAKYKDGSGGTDKRTPTAPFVTDTKAWVALGIKRAIMHAVDVGADGVVFGTGQQNADLYDLSKQVDNVSLQRMSRDEYLLLATGLDGGTVLERRLARPEDAEEYVGKGVTERLIRDMGDGYRGEARGGDLKVGGEGMRAFYDEIVPQVANDVLKKLGGGKVSGIRLGIGGDLYIKRDGETYSVANDDTGEIVSQWYGLRTQANSALEQLLEERTEQPGFPITPGMREKLAAGMPLFQGQRQPEQRGSFNPANLEISLLAKADLSTFLHETGHFFLTVYGDLAADLERRALAGEELTAGEQSIVDDMNAMLQQFGFTGEGAAGGETLGQGVDLGPRVKNPGGAKLRALVDRAAGKSLRGILDVEGNLYVWDAYLATHQRGAAEFGVPYDYLKRVHIVAEEDGVRMDADAGISEVLREKYRADPMVYFSVSGHGIISGPEFADTDGVLLQGQETTPADQPPAGVTPIQAWAAASVNQQRLVHEKFAESFEQYLFTGKAPTPGLKALFRTFTKWLSRVYGTVRQFLARNKNAQLNEELAEVMDRMLATEEAIKRAEEHMGYVQALKDAKQANMTPKQFAAYLALPEEARNEALEALRARSLRDIKWLRNRHNKIIADMQREAKEVRKALRDDIADEVKAEPVYRAAEWLKTGHMVTDDGDEVQATAGFKLSVPALEDMFPEGLGDPVPWRDLGTGRYGMLGAEGLHPDVVAEMFGFPTGRGLVDALLKMTPLGEEIEARTDQAMLEQHGDLTDPTAMAKAADEAVHNAARTRMVATELSALNSLLGSPSSLTRAARNYAEEVVKDTKLRALKAWRYAADEARAGKAALKALGKGDTQAAAEAKRQELLSHATVRAMHDAEKRVKAHLDFLRKIGRYSDNDGPVKSRDGDVVAAIRAVLADHGLATPVKGESSRGYLAALRDHNPAAADILEEILDELSSGKEWRDMTVREIDELHQALEGMWSIALRSRQMEIDGKLIGISEAAQAMRERLDELGVPTTRPGQKKAITDEERRAMKFASLRAAFTRVEFWVNTKDGNAMGPFFRYLFSPVKEAANRYRAEKTEAIKAYRALLQSIAPRLKPMKIDARELGYVFGEGTGGNGRAELLHALLHTGNGSNKRKLLLGRGWGSLNLDDSLDTSKWDAFLVRMHAEGVLTKQDWDFVQGVWDLMESFKPGAQKAHRAIFGRYFAEITAEPVLTPFGSYPGGYVPAITDKDIVDDADVRDLEALEQQGMQFSFPAPARGFTMKRQDAYAKELLLDLNSLTRHIDQVLLFTHLAAPARDAMRLLKHKKVFSALNAQDPKAISKMLIPWLNRSAKQVVENPDPHGWQAWRFWSTARNRAGLTAMFLNVANAAQQITGFSLAAVKVRPGLLAEALAHRIQHPKESGEFVRERSAMMRDRLEQDAAVSGDVIHEVLVNPSLLEKGQAWSNRHAYFLQRAVDSAMSPTIWIAAYNQAQEQGVDEADSAKFADSVVRETQGAQNPEDIAAFEAGTAFSRMFTQFAGYFNMNANLLGSEYRVLARDLGLKAGAGRALYLFLFGFLTPAVVGELIIQAFRGGPGDGDDDGSYLDDWLASLFGWAPLRYLTAMVPFAGQLVNTAVNTFNDKPYDDRISTSPAISMLETAARAPSRVLAAVEDSDKTPRAVADVGVLVGMALGIPVRPVTKALAYGMQVEENLVEPTGAPDYLRGIISGTASPASKGE